MKRHASLSLKKYCALVSEQAFAINEAINAGIPVTSLNGLCAYPVTWLPGFKTEHHPDRTVKL